MDINLRIKINDKWVFVLAFFFVFLAVILTYSNHWNNGFHFDDFHTIIDNPHIRSLGNTLSFFTDPRTASVLPSSGAYQPLRTLLLAIDYQLGRGYNPFYFHLSSFIWYLVQLGFMFFLFQGIFNKAFKHDWNKWLALFGVGWYGLHTANAETINYISAMSDLISTALVIIALVSYVYSPFLRKYWLYLVPFILGALVKQTAYMFGPLLFVYLLLVEEDSFSQALLKSLPAFIIALLFYSSVASMFSLFVKTYVTSYFTYLMSQPFVALYYFKTFFLPAGLCADYGWGAPPNILNLRFLAGFIFIVSMLILIYFSARAKKYRPIAFGILWFFLALVPTSMAPLAEIVNDHRMFFPFVGLMIAVCWSAGLLLYKYEKELKAKTFLKVLIISVGIIILLSNALGTRHRNLIWKDEESLWYDATIKSPKNGRALMNYGLTQAGKGRLDVALKYYLEAKKYYPYYHYLFINLASLYSALNNQQEAEANYKQALIYGADYNGSYYYYANWLFGQGRQKEAIPLLERSIEMSPAFLWDRQLLLRIYESQKKDDLAAMVARQILEIDPADATAWQYLIMHKVPLLNSSKAKPTPEIYLQISLIYHQQGLYQECIWAAEQALKLRPNYAEAYNNIGSAYNSMKQWDKGIVALEKALAIKPDFQLAKNNLDWAKSHR